MTRNNSGGLTRESPLALTAAVIILAALAPSAFCAQPPAYWQVVVLKASEIPTLLNVPEKHLEVLAINHGHPAPIPFQVDKVLADGEYALPHGPDANDDRSSVVGPDDEIAMMFGDLAERAKDRSTLPANAVEICAADRQTGVLRYAYIAATPSPRLSPVSYVSYEPADGRIDGISYRMTFRGDFPTGLAVNTGGGWSPNLITGAEVRVTARVLMFFTMHFGADGVNNRVLAWRAGPIRVIRRVSHSVKLMLGIRSPRVVSSEIFYPYYAEDSFVAQVLWVPRVFFGDVRVITWLDFVGINGFALSWSRMTEPPLTIGAVDPKTLAALQSDPPQVKWIALNGDGKSVTQTFMPSRDLSVVRTQLYYRSVVSPAGTPGDRNETTRHIGYVMTRWEDLPAGTHKLKSVLMVLPVTSEPSRVIRELRTPPTVSLRCVSH